MIVWMKVTTDELELPEVVADTAGELAKKCGVTVSTVYTSLCHWEHGRRNQTPYRRVRVDDSD